MNFTDIVAIIFGSGLVVNALLFVPQILKMLRTKSSEGVSLLTFGGFNLIQVVGILHGILHHDLAIFLGMTASFITCVTVNVLAIIYRPKA